MFEFADSELLNGNQAVVVVIFNNPITESHIRINQLIQMRLSANPKWCYMGAFIDIYDNKNPSTKMAYIYLQNMLNNNITLAILTPIILSDTQ